MSNVANFCPLVTIVRISLCSKQQGAETRYSVRVKDSVALDRRPTIMFTETIFVLLLNDKEVDDSEDDDWMNS